MLNYKRSNALALTPKQREENNAYDKPPVKCWVKIGSKSLEPTEITLTSQP